jgi:ribose transport system permease protein
MMKKELGLFLLLAVISAITGAINPAYLSLVNLLNMANLIGLFGVFALGEGLVIITGGIDLSLGSMFALLGVVFVDLLTTYQIYWPFALLLVLLGGLALGGIQGFLITRLKMQPFIVTLCGLLIYRGAARYYTSDSTRGFGYGDEAGTLSNIASGNIAGIPNTFIFLIILALILGVLLHRSVYGRWLYAVGKNEEAARYSGINTDLVIATAYIISGGLAGVSTVLFVFYTNSVSPSSFGNFYELYAIAAAVLGGCSLRGGEGSILGIVLGTALLQVLQNLVNILGIPNSLNFAVMGTVILLGVLADQQLQARRRRKAALAGLARTAPRSTLVQGKQSASARGTAALPTSTGDQA